MPLLDATGRPIASADDSAELTAFVDELRRKTAAGEDPIILCSPQDLIQLVSLVQLASRHPQFPDSHRAIAEELVEYAIDYFRECPTIVDVLRRGNDPAEDVPAREHARFFGDT